MFRKRQTHQSTSQGTKRTFPNQNTNSNKILKQSPKTQNQIKTFDSYDPLSKKRHHSYKRRWFSSSRKKINSNKNNLTQNKQIKPLGYAKTIGRDESYILKGKPKNLEIKLKSVKFEENITRDSSYYNLKELNPEVKDPSYRSFSFSVNYLDKVIVYVMRSKAVLQNVLIDSLRLEV